MQALVLDVIHGLLRLWNESRDHSRRRFVRLLLSRVVKDAMRVARCGRASTDTDTDTDTVVILPYGTICRYYRVRRVASRIRPNLALWRIFKES
jgi:hypothetical protein